MSDNDNIIPFGSVNTTKPEEVTPEYDYKIDTKDNETYIARGFLIFTPQHIAVMRPLEEGALPVLILPLETIKSARLMEDVQQDLPF